MEETTIIDNIPFLINRQENITVLQSVQKDKYGYNVTIKFPNNTPEDKFQKVIEGYFQREIF